MDTPIEDGTMSGYPTPNMPGFTTYLKVKIKSLAEEAKIIRREENLAPNEDVRVGLYLHRIGIVRDEARWSQLAYGFIRGLDYSEIESGGSKSEIRWDRVKNLVLRYNRFPRDTSYVRSDQQILGLEAEFKEWVEEAERYIEQSKFRNTTKIRRERVPFVYVPTPEDDAKRAYRAKLRDEVAVA